MAILKIRDAEGNVQEVLVLKGEDYILTDADKKEIADIVNTGGTGNKSLVFGSEDNLIGFVYGNENLVHYFAPMLITSFKKQDTQFINFSVPAGTYCFDWKFDWINKVDFTYIDLVVFNTTDNSSINKGVNTFTHTVDIAVYVAVDGPDPTCGNITSVDAELQVDKGETLGNPVEPFLREDGLTKEDLNIGDLLLVEAENSNNYFWNGNDIVKLNSFPSSEEVSY